MRKMNKKSLTFVYYISLGCFLILSIISFIKMPIDEFKIIIELIIASLIFIILSFKLLKLKIFVLLMDCAVMLILLKGIRF